MNGLKREQRSNGFKCIFNKISFASLRETIFGQYGLLQFFTF
jgi:hypothetical protein